MNQPATSALARAAALAGPLAVVTEVRRLAGGSHADTHLIRLSNPDLDMILREFPAGDMAAANEAHVLAILDGLDGLVPQLLAKSIADTTTTRPWVLISRLPGIADITTIDPQRCAQQLGHALARLHATPPAQWTGLRSVFERPEDGRANLHGPAAAKVHEQWDLICAAPSVLTHHDFWSGNVLWADGEISGVVDWTGGGTGPAGHDIGWCRLDLYLLYDEAVAAEFLAAYQAASGTTIDPWLWDLWAVARSSEIVETWVPNYGPLGREDLTASELRRRHTEWTNLTITRSTTGR